MTTSDLALFVRTAAHLQPSQIAHRIRLRFQRAALRSCPQASRWLMAGPDPASAVGWPPGFSPLDKRLWQDWPGMAELHTGRITLLGMTRTLAEPGGKDHVYPLQDDPGNVDWMRAHWTQADWAQADWAQPDAPQLWRFHLHYWDWVWGMAAEPDHEDAQVFFATLWRSWRSSVRVGQDDAWLAYPAALRAWTFCGIYRELIAGSEIEDSFIIDLAAHLGFLRRHLESDIGGNHLVKDLKALAGLAVFFADEQLLDWALSRLTRQLAIQVLPDGGHYERAPAYHCQVLGDFIDLADLIQVTGRAPIPELTLAIRRMRTWLGNVLSPGGDVPLLNDGYPVAMSLVRALCPSAAPDMPLLVLPDTGLVRATAADWHLLADVGLPCPDELPGHAHADTLSCLLHVGGDPLLVDTGTSTYAPGHQRSYERSTAAHNTVEVDDADSTEVWGAFRAARRARVHDFAAHAEGGVLVVEATHNGFLRLTGRPCHRRRWTLTDAGLQVDDWVTGRGRHRVVIRWHLAPGSKLRLTAGGAEASTPAGKFRITIAATGWVALAAETAPVAIGFGRTVNAPVLTSTLDAVLPLQVSTGWHRAGGEQPRSVTAAEAGKMSARLRTVDTRRTVAIEPIVNNGGVA